MGSNSEAGGGKSDVGEGIGRPWLLVEAERVVTTAYYLRAKVFLAKNSFKKCVANAKAAEYMCIKRARESQERGGEEGGGAGAGGVASTAKQVAALLRGVPKRMARAKRENKVLAREMSRWIGEVQEALAAPAQVAMSLLPVAMALPLVALFS